MAIRNFISFIISWILFFWVLILLDYTYSLLLSGINKNEEIEIKEVDKSFVELCEKNGGLMLEENFFWQITKSKCYYNWESFSFWFAGNELRLKNQILIDNFNKNGK